MSDVYVGRVMEGNALHPPVLIVADNEADAADRIKASGHFGTAPQVVVKKAREDLYGAAGISLPKELGETRILHDIPWESQLVSQYGW